MKGTVKILHRLPFFKCEDIQNIIFDTDLRPMHVWENYEGVNMSLPADEEGPIFVYCMEPRMYSVTRTYAGMEKLQAHWPIRPQPLEMETELC